MGITINMIRINPLILINYSPAVEKLNNELNENISIAELIKINFFTPHSHAYLMIEIRFKIENSWYIARALLNLNIERNFISQILITQLHLTLSERDAERIKALDSRHI
jgi:hypothetical protein